MLRTPIRMLKNRRNFSAFEYKDKIAEKRAKYYSSPITGNNFIFIKMII